MQTYKSKNGQVYNVGQPINTTHGKGEILDIVLMCFQGQRREHAIINTTDGKTVFMPLPY